MSPRLSAVVVNHGQAALAARCVGTLRDAFAGESIEGEIVLVDCASGGAETAALAAVPADVRLNLPENRGYAGGLNAGLARARGEYLLLSNADVEYRAGALTALIEALAEPGTGAAAPVCAWDAEGAVLLPPGFDPGFLEEMALFRSGRSPARDDRRFAAFAREAVALWTSGGPARHLSGAALMTTRGMLDRAGRFDERFPFEYEETEWERRVQAAGGKLRVASSARVRHLWGGGSGAAPAGSETVRRRAASRRMFREHRWGRAGRALLERAERRASAAARPMRFSPAALTEIPARAGAWLALSPLASRIPFAGADLSRPFRLPSELSPALERGDWFWTVFSGEDGRPLESFRLAHAGTARGPETIA